MGVDISCDGDCGHDIASNYDKVFCKICMDNVKAALAREQKYLRDAHNRIRELEARIEELQDHVA